MIAAIVRRFRRDVAEARSEVSAELQESLARIIEMQKLAADLLADCKPRDPNSRTRLGDRK